MYHGVNIVVVIELGVAATARGIFGDANRPGAAQVYGGRFLRFDCRTNPRDSNRLFHAFENSVYFTHKYQRIAFHGEGFNDITPVGTAGQVVGVDQVQ